jgi:hypothetical protein
MKDLFEGLVYKSDCHFCGEPDMYLSQFPGGVGHGRCIRCNQGALRCPTAVGVPGMPSVQGIPGVQVPAETKGTLVEETFVASDGSYHPVRGFRV